MRSGPSRSSKTTRPSRPCSAAVARVEWLGQAHNPKVAGSNPAPATKQHKWKQNQRLTGSMWRGLCPATFRNPGYRWSLIQIGAFDVTLSDILLASYLL